MGCLFLSIRTSQIISPQPVIKSQTFIFNHRLVLCKDAIEQIKEMHVSQGAKSCGDPILWL